jgi:hypothetical protein
MDSTCELLQQLRIDRDDGVRFKQMDPRILPDMGVKVTPRWLPGECSWTQLHR